jgi:hypothetical protein
MTAKASVPKTFSELKQLSDVVTSPSAGMQTRSVKVHKPAHLDTEICVETEE